MKYKVVTALLLSSMLTGTLPVSALASEPSEAESVSEIEIESENENGSASQTEIVTETQETSISPSKDRDISDGSNPDTDLSNDSVLDNSQITNGLLSSSQTSHANVSNTAMPSDIITTPIVALPGNNVEINADINVTNYDSLKEVSPLTLDAKNFSVVIEGWELNTGDAGPASAKINGNITSEISGVCCEPQGDPSSHDLATAEINGNIYFGEKEDPCYGAYGVRANGSGGSTVSIVGDILQIGDLDHAAGIYIYNTNLNMMGNIDTNNVGIDSIDGNIINIKGNVTSEKESALVTGFYYDYNNNKFTRDDVIIIDGTVNAKGEQPTVYLFASGWLGPDVTDLSNIEGPDESKYLENVKTPTIIVYEIKGNNSNELIEIASPDRLLSLSDDGYTELKQKIINGVNYIIRSDETSSQHFSYTGDTEKEGYRTAVEGTAITIKVDDGYEARTTGKATLTKNADGTYTLIVPRGGNVTISAIKAAIEEAEDTGSSTVEVEPADSRDDNDTSGYGNNGNGNNNGKGHGNGKGNSSGKGNNNGNGHDNGLHLGWYNDNNPHWYDSFKSDTQWESSPIPVYSNAIADRYNNPAFGISFQSSVISDAEFESSIISSLGIVPYGRTLRIESSRDIFFDRSMLQSLAYRRDIDVELIYSIGGRRYRVVIPKNYDVMSLLGLQDSRLSFYNLASILGFEEVGEY